MIGMPLRIETVPIDSLKPYPGNPRRGDLGVLTESLKIHGQYKPLIVQKSTGFILAGNHTWQALVELGEAKVAIVRHDVDDQTAKKIVLVDNKSSDDAAYDFPALAELLKSVDDLEATGYDDDSLEKLLRDLGQDDSTEAPEPIAPPKRPKTKAGDVYLLGEHRLICGDAVDPDVLRIVMDGGKAQVVITDPPYGVDYEGGMNKKKREKLAGDDSADLYGQALGVAADYIDGRAPVYLWFAGVKAQAAYGAVESIGYEVRALLIWHKLNAHYGAFMAQYMNKHEPLIYAVPKARSARWHGPKNEVTVWEHPQPARNEFHPTQKPVELCERALRNSSRPGDVVLDMFGGSGSTLLAAENAKRRARVIELDRGYCDVIVDRWQRHTGQKATKL